MIRKARKMMMFALLGAVLTTGCTQLTTRELPNVPIWKYKHVFVQ